MKIFIQMLWAFVAIGALLGIIVFVYTITTTGAVSGYAAAVCFVVLPYGLVKAFEGMLKDD